MSRKPYAPGKMLDKRNWHPLMLFAVFIPPAIFLIIMTIIKAITAPPVVCTIAKTGLPC